MTDAQTLPDPLTSADCDLRGLPYMPLEVQRLRDSDLALISTGDEFKAAILLFCASWGQVPAGSVPNDDRILAKLAGTDVSTWAVVKDVALRGWEACSDGRLYHPLVSEKAMEALPGRKAYASRATAAGDRKRREREDRARLFEEARDLGLTPAYNIKTTDLRALVTAGERDASQIVTRDMSQSASVTGHKLVTPVTIPVTQPVTAKRERGKGKEDSPQPPTGGGRDLFDEAVEAIPDRCRAPMDLALAKKAWDAIVAGDEIDAAGLLAAVKAMAEADDRSGGKLGTKAFHKWLQLGRWRNWPTAEQAKAAKWPGPAEIRAAIVNRMAELRGGRDKGEAFAASYLDSTTTWSEVPSAIVCRSGMVEKRLREAVGALLTDMGVVVMLKTEAA